MKPERCPSCDCAVSVVATNEGTHRYVPLETKSIGGKRPCAVCGGPLCMDQHSAWPKEHPYPPECDLWFGHGGMHRQMGLVPTRQDHIWGTGELTWEHGRLIETTKFTGYGPDSSQEVPCFYDGEGGSWGVDDLVPLGSEGQLGDWTITVTFEPKKRNG